MNKAFVLAPILELGSFFPSHSNTISWDPEYLILVTETIPQYFPKTYCFVCLFVFFPAFFFPCWEFTSNLGPGEAKVAGGNPLEEVTGESDKKLTGKKDKLMLEQLMLPHSRFS